MFISHTLSVFIVSSANISQNIPLQLFLQYNASYQLVLDGLESWYVYKGNKRKSARNNYLYFI